MAEALLSPEVVCAAVPFNLPILLPACPPIPPLPLVMFEISSQYVLRHVIASFANTSHFAMVAMVEGPPLLKTD